MQETRILNNGYSIPKLGLGVYQSDADTYNAVRFALDAGYRHIDTAAIYENEDQVGQAILDSGVPRSEIFITTKLWNSDMRDHTDGAVERALLTSLNKLKTDYADMYLIHWPVKDEYIRCYNILEKFTLDGTIRALGVSNFLKHHLEELLHKTGVIPVVDQIETHPYLVNDGLLQTLKKYSINLEAWAPLGKGKILSEKIFTKIGAKYGKTPAQVVIRWHLQRGHIVIPKSVHRERIVENFAVFDFSLTDEEMTAIAALDKDKRYGSHPDKFKF
ncbi:MAG: aldo/keto reductase [Christensenellaceae bacterium]|jgi:diketogulonate reductase-like aldo/keto reductase|nr:aldo/keto reductase [Christensenellaceae bacterium]